MRVVAIDKYVLGTVRISLPSNIISSIVST